MKITNQILLDDDGSIVGGDTPWACGVACGTACLLSSTIGAVFGHMIVSFQFDMKMGG